MQVGCIYTNFGGRGFFGFEDIATFINDQISLSDHEGQKIESAQKIHTSRG